MAEETQVMGMLYKYVISYDPLRFEGERYNVQEWRNLADERSDWAEDDWCYCGYGRFCKTLAQAEEWANQAYGEVRQGEKPVIEYLDC